MPITITRAAALIALLLSSTVEAGLPLDVRIYDRTAGRELLVYRQGGDRYIAGEPGHEYEIRLRNRSGGSVLAVTSVDGVNVITGRTAAPDQSGYVIEPYGAADIDGWRKSLGEVAAFYFTALPDSYAARTGRPDNVGVIGVAVFRERVYRPEPLLREQSGATADAAGPATESARSLGKLGTGHGWRRNLVAQGILQGERYARTVPDPFPGGFVPDPR